MTSIAVRTLGVGERGEEGEDERGEEARPDRPAHLGADLAHQRVDAGPEDVADDEDGEEPGTDGAAEAGVLAAAGAVAFARPAPCARGRFHAHRLPEARPGSNPRQAAVNCVAASSA
jgi:hypothetical protein